MTGGGGGIIIIKRLTSEPGISLTAEERCELEKLRERTNGGLCDKKDAKKLAAIVERAAQRVG